MELMLCEDTHGVKSLLPVMRIPVVRAPMSVTVAVAVFQIRKSRLRSWALIAGTRLTAAMGARLWTSSSAVTCTPRSGAGS